MKQGPKKIEGNNARERLLEAGTALFGERGYAGTFVREIVDRAGVTKPMLYYYFKSKEGMFYTILDGAAEQQEVILAQALEAPGAVLDRLIYLYRRIYEGLIEHQNLFKMIYNLVFGPRQGAPDYDIDQYHRRMVDAIKTIYLEGLAQGEVKEADADEVAILVLSLLDFCLHMEYVHLDSSDPERPERLLRLAFQGLGESIISDKKGK
ncbi:MAG: TetR/AcrR family transcriptional regulator [Desulfobacteraceae bacterium]|nr:MAG: TetR/AcrR family transcriptional regulator [Desulfobacteraceae bacterium]